MTSESSDVVTEYSVYDKLESEADVTIRGYLNDATTIEAELSKVVEDNADLGQNDILAAEAVASDVVADAAAEEVELDLETADSSHSEYSIDCSETNVEMNEYLYFEGFNPAYLSNLETSEEYCYTPAPKKAKYSMDEDFGQK